MPSDLGWRKGYGRSAAHAVGGASRKRLAPCTIAYALSYLQGTIGRARPRNGVKGEAKGW